MTRTYTAKRLNVALLFFGAFVMLLALGALAREAAGRKSAGPQGRAVSRLLRNTQRPRGEARAMNPQNPLFFPAVMYDSGGQLGWSVAVADLNRDSKSDIVVVNYVGGINGNGSVGVLLGNGDGTFQPVVTYDSGGGGSTAVAVGDLNKDGKLDAVVANQGCPGINNECLGVLLGKGDGTFNPVVIYPTGGFPISDLQGYLGPALLIVDLNGDGKSDLALGINGANNPGNGSVTVLLGNGDGTFQPMASYDSGGVHAAGLALADLNADGKPDFVVLNCASTGSSCPGNAVVGVLLGRGDGTFKPVQTYGTGGPSSVVTTAVVVADMNADGKPDILVGNSCPLGNNRCVGDATAGVLLGNGDGTFHAVVNYDSGGFEVGSMAVADLSGDGKPDLVVANYDNAGIGVLLGNGDGTLQPVHEQFTVAGTAVLIADVNHDDKLDLILPSGPNNVGGVLLGNGDGTFKGSLIFSLGGSQYSSGFAVADVNGDGRPDLLSANWCGNPCLNEEGAVGVLLNNKNYIFSGSATVLSSSINPAHTFQTVTYTATVTSQSGQDLTGVVVFEDGGSVIAVAGLAGNQGAFPTKYKTPGTHTMTAIYSGDSTNGSSTSTPVTEIILATTKTLVTTSGSPSQVGQAVTFTATVTSKFGPIPNGELVTFSDGKKILASVSLSGEKAMFTTSSLSAGKHYIKATYPGDSFFYKSHRIVTQVVNP